MASPEAGAIKIVTTPRLPFSRLRELRRFLDQTVFGFPSEDRVPVGGDKHGEVESSPDEPVRESTDSRTTTSATTEGTGVARIAVDRSPCNEKRMRGSRKTTGGRS